MSRLGSYELERVLARGGMAEVWLARRNSLGGFSKQVVVKRVLPHLCEDPSFMELFMKEARVAALFTHPNLVRVFELGSDQGTWFIAMEYVRGGTLRALQRACFEHQTGLPLDVFCRLLVDACEGLQYAHELKDLKGRPLELVHLDVSPENLLISVDGVTKVSDFGVARAREHSRSMKLELVLGKAVYMPPEQAASRPLDRRADIYALGAIAYEIAVGKVPIEVDSAKPGEPQILAGNIDFAAVREISQGLEPVLRRALSHDPAQRQATTLQLAAELVAALGEPASHEAVAATLAELVPAAAPAAASPPMTTPVLPKNRPTTATPTRIVDTRPKMPASTAPVPPPEGAS